MNRTKPLPSIETASEEPDEHRLRHERRLIDEARASVAAGQVVSDDEIDAWLDHMVDSEEPMPIPGDQRRTRDER